MKRIFHNLQRISMFLRTLPVHTPLFAIIRDKEKPWAGCEESGSCHGPTISPLFPSGRQVPAHPVFHLKVVLGGYTAYPRLAKASHKRQRVSCGPQSNLPLRVLILLLVFLVSVGEGGDGRRKVCEWSVPALPWHSPRGSVQSVFCH